MKTNTILLCLALISLGACSLPRTGRETVELTRKPYLQSALADSLTVLWRTNLGRTCKVGLRPKGTSRWSFVEGETRGTNTGLVENEVTLHGLVANTTYEYRIYTEKTRLLPGQDLWFTAPVGDRDSIFTFFAVGDIGEPVEDGGTPHLLGEALKLHIDSLRFGLLLGDIIYPDGKSELYDSNLFQYFGLVFPYVPVFPVLGNHDWHEPDENYVKEWKLPGNEHYYSFDYGNAHFVALDTKMGDVLHDYESQVKWLEDDLSNVSGDQDWKIVFLHHNGRSCTYKKDYEAVVGLYPIFEKFGVDLVLNGHAHTYERLNPMNGSGEVVPTTESEVAEYHDPAGFICITAGSGGKLRGIGSDPTPFSPDPDHCRYPGLVAAFSHTWAFLMLSIEGGTLTGKAISTEDGEVVDSFQIHK